MRKVTPQDLERYQKLNGQLNRVAAKLNEQAAVAVAARRQLNLAAARSCVLQAEGRSLREKLSAIQVELGYPPLPPIPPAQCLPDPTPEQLAMVRDAAPEAGRAGLRLVGGLDQVDERQPGALLH
jgi:hypothetical protein